MQLCALVPAVDKARLYRGKGGENMREAISRFIEQAAVARLRFNAVQHGKVGAAVHKALAGVPTQRRNHVHLVLLPVSCMMLARFV